MLVNMYLNAHSMTFWLGGSVAQNVVTRMVKPMGLISRYGTKAHLLSPQLDHISPRAVVGDVEPLTCGTASVSRGDELGHEGMEKLASQRFLPLFRVLACFTYLLIGRWVGHYGLFLLLGIFDACQLVNWRNFLFKITSSMTKSLDSWPRRVIFGTRRRSQGAEQS